MYAEQTKDFDKLLMVLTRDLASPYRFLEIAEACKEFGKLDLAVIWAERGLAAFPMNQDSRLRSFLAVEQMAQGRTEDALMLLWKNLENSGHQYLQAYKELKALAEKAGQWAEWQAKAMDLLKEGKTFGKGADASVAVLVYEKRLKEAYAEASSKGCTEYGWKKLAEALSKSEPKLSYDAHRRLYVIVMEDYTSTTARTNLAWTVKQMDRLAGIVGAAKEFKAWLEEQKVLNKRRTGFLNDLKGVGL
jgi:tetratricopeptide (TPR) repeat protein